MEQKTPPIKSGVNFYNSDFSLEMISLFLFIIFNFLTTFTLFFLSLPIFFDLDIIMIY